MFVTWWQRPAASVLTLYGESVSHFVCVCGCSSCDATLRLRRCVTVPRRRERVGISENGTKMQYYFTLPRPFSRVLGKRFLDFKKFRKPNFSQQAGSKAQEYQPLFSTESNDFRAALAASHSDS
jgi:hypothetical protein